MDYYSRRYLIVHDGVKSNLSGCTNAQMKQLINKIVSNNNIQISATKNATEKKDLIITNARLNGWIGVLGNKSPNQQWGKLDLMMMLI